MPVTPGLLRLELGNFGQRQYCQCTMRNHCTSGSCMTLEPWSPGLYDGPILHDFIIWILSWWIPVTASAKWGVHNFAFFACDFHVYISCIFCIFFAYKCTGAWDIPESIESHAFRLWFLHGSVFLTRATCKKVWHKSSTSGQCLLTVADDHHWMPVQEFIFMNSFKNPLQWIHDLKIIYE